MDQDNSQMDEEQDENMVDEYGDMEEDYDNYYYGDSALEAVRSVSANAPYQFVSSGKIMQKIDEAIAKLKELMSMEYGWCFEIYERCTWNISTVLQMMDKKVNFRELVQYKPGYQLTKTPGKETCEVCLEETHLLINSCSHRFCELCWTMNFEISVNNNKEIIPKCQGDSCSSRMNYLLIKHILDKPENSQLQKQYQTQLILQYSRQNNEVKVCPHPKCNTTFMMERQKLSPMWCKCEDAICAFCGQFYHYPIYCSEGKNWEKMVMDHENQWIKIVMSKVCPSCKNPIEKNEGCNHMTCRCRHEFCWICLKDWRTHGVCQGRQEHDRMQNERQKILKNEKQYREKFEQCKEGTGRYEAIIKRLNSFECQPFRESLFIQFQIPMKDSEFLTEIVPLILVSMRFCRCCLIYKFFRDEENLLSIHSKRVDQESDLIDDELTGIRNLVTKYENQQFQDLKDEAKKKVIEKFSPENRLKLKDRMSRLKEFLVKIFENID